MCEQGTASTKRGTRQPSTARVAGGTSTERPEPQAGTTLADALLDALDDAALRALAGRLRPYLLGQPERLLDAPEAAALLGLHPETLVRMARNRRVWACKVGREWRFRADRLEIRSTGTRSVSPAPAPRPRRPLASERPSTAAIRGRQ
jgi:excisionase family DNA binding protein